VRRINNDGYNDITTVNWMLNTVSILLWIQSSRIPGEFLLLLISSKDTE
jgi:hypothetical protein